MAKRRQKNWIVEGDVGVSKTGKDVKFADQLAVRKDRLKAWEANRSRGPLKVDAFSNKSRRFDKMTAAERQGLVTADVAEAIQKYSGGLIMHRGKVRVGKGGKKIKSELGGLKGQVVEVETLYLVYDGRYTKGLQAEIRQQAMQAATNINPKVKLKVWFE